MTSETSKRPDPRLNAYRDDLASLNLKGIVEAERYVEGEIRQVTVPSAPLKSAPRPNASLDTEVLFGEELVIFDEQDGWAWIQNQVDGYVGYVASDCLGAPGASGVKSTHVVNAPSTFIYPGPDMKLPALKQLPMNARTTPRNITGDFVEIADTGYVFAKHLRAQGEQNREGSPDFVDIAKLFVGTPYLWGGRTYAGIDCSGLVQTAMMASGQDCLRDTDMQENSIGDGVDHQAGVGNLAKGDLIFWRGHVGIMVSAGAILHANAFHMQTVIEPYEQVRLRIAATDTGDVRTIRRL